MTRAFVSPVVVLAVGRRLRHLTWTAWISGVRSSSRQWVLCSGTTSWPTWSARPPGT